MNIVYEKLLELKEECLEVYYNTVDGIKTITLDAPFIMILKNNDFIDSVHISKGCYTKEYVCFIGKEPLLAKLFELDYECLKRLYSGNDFDIFISYKGKSLSYVHVDALFKIYGDERSKGGDY